jgi:hypothetical protein
MSAQAAKTNEERVIEFIRQHPEGVDDDEVSAGTGVRPRQQVQKITSSLARGGLIRRESLAREGKRRKIHNLPLPVRPDRQGDTPAASAGASEPSWRRRLSALRAATDLTENEILDRALADFARRVLAEGAER